MTFFEKLKKLTANDNKLIEEVRKMPYDCIPDDIYDKAETEEAREILHGIISSSWHQEEYNQRML